MQLKTWYSSSKMNSCSQKVAKAERLKQKHFPPRKYKTLGIIYINDKLQSYDNSLSVNLPNVFKCEGCSDTNLFPTSIKDILSTISGFSFSKVRVLNLFCFTVDRSYVLRKIIPM